MDVLLCKSISSLFIPDETFAEIFKWRKMFDTGVFN